MTKNTKNKTQTSMHTATSASALHSSPRKSGGKIDSLFVSFTFLIFFFSFVHVISVEGLFVEGMHVNIDMKEVTVPTTKNHLSTSLQVQQVISNEIKKQPQPDEKIKLIQESENEESLCWWMKVFSNLANEPDFDEATQKLTEISKTSKRKIFEINRKFKKEFQITPSEEIQTTTATNKALDANETKVKKSGVCKVWDEAKFTEGGIVGLLLTLLWRLIEWSNERRDNNNNGNDNNDEDNTTSNNGGIRTRTRRHVAVDYAATPIIVMGICSILPGLISK